MLKKIGGNVAVFTNIQDNNPGYSLVSVIQDQVRMLTRYGHKTHLYVSEVFNDNFPPTLQDTSCSEQLLFLEKKIPKDHLIDYRSKNDISEEHKQSAKRLAKILVEEIISKEIDFVFTHDWVFTGWNLIYALAIQEAADSVRDVRWLHWIHSLPNHGFDWWRIRDYGKGHKLVSLTHFERLRVAEAYHGTLEDVRVIPHIKDLRSWFDFSEETCEFIDDYPGVMQDDVVCVYPASVDRLEAKRVDKVLLILSKIKNTGWNVTFVCANQWATGRAQKEDMQKYYKIAKRNGLTPHEDFIFTSDFNPPAYERGIGKKMLRELLLCSNLFLFPTREEAFGLVSLEASLCGAMVVLNQALPSMFDIHGFTTLYANFGSYYINHVVSDEKTYYEGIASIIKARMIENEGIHHRTKIRQSYNFDRVYESFYRPILAESDIW